MPRTKKVIILGAGFGGVRCALTLESLIRKSKFPYTDIVLIDKNRYHTFIPSLYEIASAEPGVSEETLHRRVNILVKDIIKNKHIKFIKGEINSIDSKNHRLTFTEGDKIAFDYLVIALGSQANFYHIKGLKEHAITLKDFISAISIRRALKLADEMPRSVIIGGGGTTGVELAAELKICFRSMYPQITIIESAPRLLSSFSPYISRLATKRLTALGIKLKLGQKIQEVHDSSVILDNGEALAFDRLLWTGGIAPHPLIGKLEAGKENDFLKVSPSLNLISSQNEKPYSHIFALGDASIVYDKTGNPIPWTAQKAMSEGAHIARAIADSLRGEVPKVYAPEPIRFIIPIGGKWAIVKLNGITYAGVFGWVLKYLVELRYLCSILPWHRAILRWLML